MDKMGSSMKIPVVKFGKFLMSRPAGREAALIMCTQFVPKSPEEIIELDFKDVKSVGPSWLHEIMLGLKTTFPNKIVVIDCGNASVIESMKFVD
jgi:STAS-like domain of unknown function (DUF4325)